MKGLREGVYEEIVGAYESVPFYSELAKAKNLNIRSAKFEDLPKIKKEDLIYSRYSNINPVCYNESKDFFRVKTTGSTGECYEILWDCCDEKNHYFRYGYIEKNIME